MKNKKPEWDEPIFELNEQMNILWINIYYMCIFINMKWSWLFSWRTCACRSLHESSEPAPQDLSVPAGPERWAIFTPSFLVGRVILRSKPIATRLWYPIVQWERSCPQWAGLRALQHGQACTRALLSIKSLRIEDMRAWGFLHILSAHNKHHRHTAGCVRAEVSHTPSFMYLFLLLWSVHFFRIQTLNSCRKIQTSVRASFQLSGESTWVYRHSSE